MRNFPTFTSDNVEMLDNEEAASILWDVKRTDVIPDVPPLISGGKLARIMRLQSTKCVIPVPSAPDGRPVYLHTTPYPTDAPLYNEIWRQNPDIRQIWRANEIVPGIGRISEMCFEDVTIFERINNLFQALILLQSTYAFVQSLREERDDIDDILKEWDCKTLDNPLQIYDWLFEKNIITLNEKVLSKKIIARALQALCIRGAADVSLNFDNEQIETKLNEYCNEITREQIVEVCNTAVYSCMGVDMFHTYPATAAGTVTTVNYADPIVRNQIAASTPNKQAFTLMQMISMVAGMVSSNEADAGRYPEAGVWQAISAYQTQHLEKGVLANMNKFNKMATRMPKLQIFFMRYLREKDFKRHAVQAYCNQMDLDPYITKDVQVQEMIKFISKEEDPLNALGEDFRRLYFPVPTGVTSTGASSSTETPTKTEFKGAL